ncbi:MAG: tail fiber protein [Saprospiraceae bacterium]|nr:tail fiber protein [Saprospiraceae bacterium]
MQIAGLILLYAGNNVPYDWLPCDGRLLDRGANVLLFNMIGTQYGGDGRSTFAIPKKGKVNNLHYIICTDGELIDMQLSDTFDVNDENRYAGAVLPFAGGNVPDGWALCDGKQLKIDQNVVLFATIGITFNTGKIDQNHFCLPKTDKPHIICVSGLFVNS